MTLSIKKDISLAPLTTFHIGGNAKFFTEVRSVEELTEAVEFAKKSGLAIFVLGGGSNILVSDDGFDGLVIKMSPVRGKTSLKEGSSANHAFQAGRTSNGMNIQGIKYEDTPEGILFTIWAGENWDDVVSQAVELDLGGMENLSLIPGTVGGAVYQNIGAYGAEIKNVISVVKVYNSKTGNVVRFLNKECDFEYRSSVFKKNKELIVIEVELLLSKDQVPNISYFDLQKRFNGEHPTMAEVRQAVIEIRQNKLPYPDEVSNAGSFFKNPVVLVSSFQFLVSRYPDLKGRDTGNGLIKLSAAQLIEKAGWKGKRFGSIGVSEKHALVLVNYGGGTAKDLANLQKEIVESVKSQFGVKLAPEVEKIPVP